MRVTTFGDDALGTHDMVGLRQALARGEVAPHEVRAAALGRMRVASALGALVTRVDLTGEGPFAGVPTVVKDTEDLAGYATTMGSRATPRGPATQSSTFVRLWSDLGFDILGKSTMPEFGLTATTEPAGSAPTRNPWSTDHSTGGSSGGSAALVAAGVVPIAHANDGGGSIRIPAACCGLVGLKPSRGRLPDVDGISALPVNIVTQGVLTRTVRDTVEFYRRVAGLFPARHLPPIRSTREPGPLRVGMITDGAAGLPVDREVRAAVEAAAADCEALGHHVEPLPVPVGEPFTRDFLRYWGMLAFLLTRLGRQAFGAQFRPELLEPFSLYLGAYFTGIAARMPASVRRLRGFAAEYERLFERFDILMSPVLSSPPARLGHLGPDVAPREHLVRLLRYASFTPAQNVSGTPAISLPLGMSGAGTPIGVQFGSRMGADQILLDLAATLEAQRTWARTDLAVGPPPSVDWATPTREDTP